jgi:leader peptidase (prepilin peptidase) / N-methyltransferase
LSAVIAPLGYWTWVVQRHEPPTLAGIYVALMLALVVVTFIDLRWRIIPDRISYGLMFAGPVLSLIYPRLMETGLSDCRQWAGPGNLGSALGWLGDHPHAGALAASLAGLAFGAALIYLIRAVGTLVFRKEAMGLGDAKLLAGVGGLLGWKAVPLIFLLAVFIGAVVGLAVFLRTRRHDIPFGPYLAAGSVAVMFFGNPIWKWYLGLMNITGGNILT